jgi:hypothetical protein
MATIPMIPSNILIDFIDEKLKKLYAFSKG